MYVCVFLYALYRCRRRYVYMYVYAKVLRQADGALPTLPRAVSVCVCLYVYMYIDVDIDIYI